MEKEILGRNPPPLFNCSRKIRTLTHLAPSFFLPRVHRCTCNPFAVPTKISLSYALQKIEWLDHCLGKKSKKQNKKQEKRRWIASKQEKVKEKNARKTKRLHVDLSPGPLPIPSWPNFPQSVAIVFLPSLALISVVRLRIQIEKNTIRCFFTSVHKCPI